MSDTLPPHVSQAWTTTKPPVRGKEGMVVAQARDAALAGIAILRAGGNAVDAAVAAAFALAAVEPWNSGLGGIGFALVQRADEARAQVVDFGPVSPRALDPGAFRPTGQAGGDLFGWPAMEGDINVHGPRSVCVPRAVAGYAAMHARWGTMPWRDLLAPAIALARRGLAYDWYAALRVLQSAATLRLYPETARIYVPGGLPRAAEHPARFVPLGALAATLERIAEVGWQDFYTGDIAATLVADLTTRGGWLAREDLRAASAEIGPARELPWRDGAVQVADERTAGPALLGVLRAMTDAPRGDPPGQSPGSEWYAALARGLLAAQAARLGHDGSTSHLCVADRQGGMVSLTTTLLSPFGSRVVLPQSGVLMNNGVMWFDPRADRPNGIAPGARPLTNMVPLIWRRGDRPALAAGGSGGRRILAAVAQVLLLATDFAMPPDQAAAAPRIDVSSPDRIVADLRLAPDIVAALAEVAPVTGAEPLIAPGLFAAPSLIAIDEHGGRAGAADAISPWSTALSEAAM